MGRNYTRGARYSRWPLLRHLESRKTDQSWVRFCPLLTMRDRCQPLIGRRWYRRDFQTRMHHSEDLYTGQPTLPVLYVPGIHILLSPSLRLSGTVAPAVGDRQAPRVHDTSVWGGRTLLLLLLRSLPPSSTPSRRCPCNPRLLHPGSS